MISLMEGAVLSSVTEVIMKAIGKRARDMVMVSVIL
jgi:hypothetical protein